MEEWQRFATEALELIEAALPPDRIPDTPSLKLLVMASIALTSATDELTALRSRLADAQTRIHRLEQKMAALARAAGGH